MIESALYFALGFLLAAFLALVIAPSLWKRAVRLTSRRLEASTPLTLAEIKADRDQIRAQFARETRRLELTVGAMRRNLADAQVETHRGRDVVRAAAAEREGMQQRLGEAESAVATLRSEVEAAVQLRLEAEQKLETQLAAYAEEEARIAAMQGELDSRRLEVATFRTKIDSLEARAATLQNERKLGLAQSESLAAELARRTEELAAERDRLRHLDAALIERGRDLTAKTDELRALQQRLADAESRAAALGASVDGAREDAERARQDAGRAREEAQQSRRQAEALKADLARSLAEVAAARRDGEKLKSEVRASATGQGDNIARTIDDLERSKADLEARTAALAREKDMLAAEKAALAGELANLKAAGAGPDRAETLELREKLAALAAEVTRMAALAEGKDSPIHALIGTEDGALNGATTDDADPDATILVGLKKPKPQSLADRIRALQKAAETPQA